MKFRNDTLIECPRCGSTYLHLIQVEAFFRDAEDSKTGIHATVSEEGVDLNRDAEHGNPSPRREGLKLLFMCEGCSDDADDSPYLTIAQSKGQTALRWSDD